MSRARLVWLVVPLAGLAAFEAVRHLVVQTLLGDGGSWSLDHVLAGAVLAAAVVAFVVGIGRLLRRLHEQEMAALRERARIGMDLHDGVIQELYGLGLKLEALADEVEVDPSVAPSALREVRSRLQRVTGAIRSYVYALGERERSVDLDDAVRRVAAELGGVGPTIQLELASEVRLPAATAAHAAHVVREALSNAVRHADARVITLRTFAEDGSVRVVIQDDGRGFDPRGRVGGLGLGHLARRAAWCRGALTIDSAPGRGTSIVLDVPVERSEEGSG